MVNDRLDAEQERTESTSQPRVRPVNKPAAPLAAVSLKVGRVGIEPTTQGL